MPHSSQLLPAGAAEAATVTAIVGAGNEVAAATGVLVAGNGATVWVGGTAVSVALGDSVTVAVIVALSVCVKTGPGVTLANGVPDTRVGVAVAVGGTGVGVSLSFAGGGTGVDTLGVLEGNVCRSGLCSGVAHTALTDSDAAKMMPNVKTIKTRSDFIVHLYPLESRKRTSI
jgi:hypothetical protein